MLLGLVREASPAGHAHFEDVIQFDPTIICSIIKPQGILRGYFSKLVYYHPLEKSSWDREREREREREEQE